MPVKTEDVRGALRQVYDPEVGINIVDLGLVYDIIVHADDRVYVEMTLTTQGCPMAVSMPQAVHRAAATVPGVTDVEVNLIWHPPWHPGMITQEGRSALMRR